MTGDGGIYGEYGGQYVPETLMNAVIELDEAYHRYIKDPDFLREVDELNRKYTGRPSMLYYADRMTRDLGGAKVYLKREDLNHTGAHKINNVIGQCLLAKRMGKTRVIAETGAGQHGVATATLAAYLGQRRVEIGVVVAQVRRVKGVAPPADGAPVVMQVDGVKGVTVGCRAVTESRLEKVVVVPVHVEQRCRGAGRRLPTDEGAHRRGVLAVRRKDKRTALVRRTEHIGPVSLRRQAGRQRQQQAEEK